MHGRNLQTIDPRIRTMSGRSMSWFHGPGNREVRKVEAAVNGGGGARGAEGTNATGEGQPDRYNRFF